MITTHRVRVTKKNDATDVFEGTMTDDGLQSLWTVKLDDGGTRYASVLDCIDYLDEVTL